MLRSRSSRALQLALAVGMALALAVAARVTAAGPPFPDPAADRSVYDEVDLIGPDAEAALEERIDAIEARTGAELVVYLQADPDISEDENLNNAAALMEQWGVGRSGVDDGLVLLVARDPHPGQTRVSLFGGSGFLAAYANEEALKQIIDQRLVPRARAGNWEGALIATVDALDARITVEARGRLEALRVANGLLGLMGAPLVLLLMLGSAYLAWRRAGDDPELSDSPSVLMAGPPAGMTPPLATVLGRGMATQHSLNTLLVELASTGRIAFHNLDQVASARSDNDPDPAIDPAIEVLPEPATARQLAGPQQEAWETIQAMAGGSRRLDRERLWSLNSELGRLNDRLEDEATRLGWFTRRPTPAINFWSAVGVAEMVAGGGAILVGFAVPMSGALLLGGALIVGGLGTLLFGRAMSQRTRQGAYVYAMLKAYRRTLEKTLAQARSMQHVTEEPTVRVLADTPDKAVLWGIALSLHPQVAEVLARGLADARQTDAAAAYYPIWLGTPTVASTDDAATAPAGIVQGSGGILAASAIPDIGSMFDALGSIGSSPPSSSSGGSGGGFSGGSSSGGGGASGSV